MGTVNTQEIGQRRGKRKDLGAVGGTALQVTPGDIGTWGAGVCLFFLKEQPLLEEGEERARTDDS